MLQFKFSIEESQAVFLNNFKLFGFKNKSSLVREALNRLKKELENKKLEESAELYAEDSELKEITESAIEKWPS